METLEALVARDRRADRPALVAPVADRRMSYRDLCTTAWRTGNFLRHLGVGPGHTVAVAADPLPEPVLTFLGAAQLGATTSFLPEEALADGADHVDADSQVRAVVVGHEREGDVAVPSGTRLAVYGGEPSSPTTAHWEGQVWSETPAFPPTDVDGDTAALAVDGDEYTHAGLLRAGADVVSDLHVGSADEIVVSDSLCDPGAVVGVVAALRVGATARLAGDSPGVLRSGSGTIETASVLAD